MATPTGPSDHIKRTRLYVPKLSKDRKEKFWALVDKGDGPGSCWRWMGEVNGFVLEDGHTYKATRIAYADVSGEQPPGKLAKACPGSAHDRATEFECIRPDHTAAWPPKAQEKRLSEKQVREMAAALNTLVRAHERSAKAAEELLKSVDSRLVDGAERTEFVSAQIADLSAAVVDLRLFMGDSVEELRGQLAGVEARIATLSVPAAPARQEEEETNTLLSFYRRVTGYEPNGASVEDDAILIGVLDRALSLRRGDAPQASQLYRSWVTRFGKLVVANEGMARSPASFVRNLEAIAPEAAGEGS